jgi:anti-sigma B factor antagonist
MGYTRTDDGDETIITLEGTLDAVTSSDFRPVVDKLVAENRRNITLDFSNLRLIDSAGVGLIVSLYKRTRANNGQVRIVGLRDQPRALFRLLRLDRVFPV